MRNVFLRGGWPCLLLLVALQPAPNLTAHWTATGRAVITWAAPTRSCLSVRHQTGEAAFIGCWEDAGAHEKDLGGAETDGSIRPQAHDIYTLTNGSGAIIGTAPLVGRPVYLPVIR